MTMPPDAYSPIDAQVRDNTAADRYEVTVEGQTAFLEYTRRDHAIVLIHTDVPVSLRSRGIGTALAKTALDAARADGLRVIVRCPFVQAFIESHPEYRPEGDPGA